MIAQPIARRRAADVAELLFLLPEDDPVADHVAIGCGRDVLLGLVDHPAFAGVDHRVAEQLQRIRAAEIEVHHVVRLVEQHRRMLPGPLLGAPVGELGRDHRIDVGAELRVAQHLDDVALAGEQLFQVFGGHCGCLSLCEFLYATHTMFWYEGANEKRRAIAPGGDLPMPDVQILTLSCADRPGITARVTGYLFEHGGNILEAQQFNDLGTAAFFMRVEFYPDGADLAALHSGFAALADEYGMHWQLRAKAVPRKVLMLVSKFVHCLGDLLDRQRIGGLPMVMVGIVGNHPREALNISLLGDIPFHHFQITKDTKPQQEARIKALVDATGAELIVLARYMQILSDDL